MATLPKPPKEVPVERRLEVLAPAFRVAVEALLRDLEAETGFKYRLFETLRTPERQAFLFGAGREWDDGRGIVTNARTSLDSWHGFSLAVDIVEKDATPWDVPPGFWEALGRLCKKHGLTWGGDWKKPDRPHVQWGRCPASPSPLDKALWLERGAPAVWERHKAT